jgi:hypothetical protein
MVLPPCFAHINHGASQKLAKIKSILYTLLDKKPTTHLFSQIRFALLKVGQTLFLYPHSKAFG